MSNLETRNVAIVGKFKEDEEQFINAIISNNNYDINIFENSFERAEINYKDFIIKIINVPNNLNSAKKVEEATKVVDEIIIVIDATEGVTPKITNALKKSFELNVKPIVVINGIEEPEANSINVVNEVTDLFVVLDATDKQLDFPVVYVSEKNSIAKLELEEENKNKN